MFRAEAYRCRGGVDDRGVVAAGVLVEDAVGAGTEEALHDVLRDIGDIADGVQAVLAQQRGGLPSHAGQFPYGPGPQEGRDRLGGVVDDGAPSERREGAGHGGERQGAGHGRLAAHAEVGERAELDEFGDAAGIALPPSGRPGEAEEGTPSSI